MVGGSGTVYSDPYGTDAEWVRKVNTNHEDAPYMVVSVRSSGELVELTNVQASSIEELRAYPSARPVIPTLLDPVLTSPGFDDVRALLEDPTVILSKREIWSVTGTILDRKRNPNDRRLGEWIGQYRRGRRLPDEGERSAFGGSEEGEIDVSEGSDGNESEVEERSEEQDDLEEGEIDEGIARSDSKKTIQSLNVRFNENSDKTPYTGATPQAAWERK